MARVRLCAQLAQINADIERMPIGYECLIGSIGSTLSGGQKQHADCARYISDPASCCCEGCPVILVFLPNC